jgi:hypothetical protein
MAQNDPYPRSLLQFGSEQPLSSNGPQSLHAYYYYNNPDFLHTNTALRLAVAPVHLDGEFGFRQILSPRTHVALALRVANTDNYYDMRQGHYHHDARVDGLAGGVSLTLPPDQPRPPHPGPPIRSRRRPLLDVF